MTADTLLFGYLRRKLGKLEQADVDEFNAVLRAWKQANGLEAATAPPEPSGLSGTANAVAPAGEAPRGSEGALQPSPSAFALIREYEGYAKALPDGGCKAYPDPASGGDPWTIGFGSTGPDVKPGTVWTRRQAEERLEADVRRFAAGVAKRIGAAPTAQHEFDAMVSLAYNIGLGNFEKSTLLRMHKAGDKAGAAGQFARWNRAAGKPMAGLTRRREAEARMYRGQA